MGQNISQNIQVAQYTPTSQLQKVSRPFYLFIIYLFIYLSIYLSIIFIFIITIIIIITNATLIIIILLHILFNIC